MTFKEKLKKEHPESPVIKNGFYTKCPVDYGYEHYEDDETNCPRDISGERLVSCKDCWNREIPEEKEENKMIYAHVGKYEGHPDPVGERGPEGQPGLPEWGERKIKSFDPNKFCDTCGWARGLKCTCEEDCTDWDHWKEKEKEPIRLSRDEVTKLHEIVEKAMEPKILDSGNRRQFESGAVRDIQEGKGRCDLLPLDVVAKYIELTYMDDIRGSTIAKVLMEIEAFQRDGCTVHLYNALEYGNPFDNIFDMPLEVSKHFEEGAKKYGENNWQKGIPVHCYIDSAVRHYLKFLRGDKDEPHDRAFCWNIMCAIWTCKHKPELNDYDIKQVSENVKNEMIAERKHKSVEKAYDILIQGRDNDILYSEAIETAIGYLGEVLDD